MTVVDLIAKWFGLSGPSLIDLLNRAAELQPDLKPVVDRWLTALNAVPTPGNLAQVGTAVIGELANIGQGKFDPRRHPSDSA